MAKKTIKTKNKKQKFEQKFRRLKIGSITQILFSKIEEATKGGLDILDLIITPLPDFYKKVYYGPPSFKNFLSPIDAQQAYSKLKEKGYIREEIRDKNKRVIITDKGKVEILRSRILRKRKDNWDKKWRVIIFDVAEDKRKYRDFLRRELKWLGFLELQKSVWIFPFDVEKELRDLVGLFEREIKGDIRFLTIEKMNPEEDFREYFKLF